MWGVSSSRSGCWIVTYESLIPSLQDVSRSDPGVRVDVGLITLGPMSPQCWSSVVHVLVISVDIGVVIYEAMSPQCWSSVVHVLVISVDIGVVIYEAMTLWDW